MYVDQVYLELTQGIWEPNSVSCKIKSLKCKISNLFVYLGDLIVRLPVWEQVDELLRLVARPHQPRLHRPPAVLGGPVAQHRLHCCPPLGLPSHSSAAWNNGQYWDIIIDIWHVWDMMTLLLTRVSTYPWSRCCQCHCHHWCQMYPLETIPATSTVSGQRLTWTMLK